MDTITSGPLGPRSERPVQVLRCFVGRKDPTPPRHATRRPRLPEVGSKAARGVTCLSIFATLRIHPSSMRHGHVVFWSVYPSAQACRCHLGNVTTIRRVSGGGLPRRTALFDSKVSSNHLTTSRTIHSFHPPASSTITISTPLHLCLVERLLSTNYNRLCRNTLIVPPLPRRISNHYAIVPDALLCFSLIVFPGMKGYVRSFERDMFLIFSRPIGRSWGHFISFNHVYTWYLPSQLKIQPS